MAQKKPKRRGKAPVLVAIKIPITDLIALKARARYYAKGNLSAWLRHTGLKYIPKKRDEVVTVTMPSAKKKR